MDSVTSHVFDNDASTVGKPYSYSAYAKAAFIAAIIAVAYYRVAIDLAMDWWTDESASQGMLIPPLAVYLAWLHRKAIFSHDAVTDSRGLLLTAFGCVTFLGGKLGAEFFLTRTSLVFVLAGLTWTFWGIARLRVLAFPFVLLLTMVPLPVILSNALAAPLQLFASDISANLAQALGVAVYRDGNIIHLANISLGVMEACSGLHSLSALIVASLLLGYLQCSRVLTRVALFAAAIPLAIAVNVVRVTGTAILADYKQEFAMGFYHSFSGWLVFVVGFGLLWALAKGLHRFERQK
jgi:exosortase